MRWCLAFLAILISKAAAAESSGIEKAILNTQAAGYQSTIQARCKFITYDQAESVLTNLELELRPFAFSLQRFILRQYAMGQQAADREYFAFPGTCSKTDSTQINLIRRFSDGTSPIIKQYIQPTR